MPKILIITIAILLVACGGSTASTQQRDPDSAHKQWIEVVQAGDREAIAQNIVTMDNKDIFIEQVMQAQYRLHDETGLYGEFQNVEIRPVENNRGVSVWTYANKTECYETILSQEANTWKVHSWGGTNLC